MRKSSSIFMMALLVVLMSCKGKETKQLSAQTIVDKSIEVCGGELNGASTISFEFRDRKYVKESIDNQKILKRIIKNDTMNLVDIKAPIGFERYVDGKKIQLPDSLANAYANSVNSVHYFAYLPYGLNDPAVNKEYLGEITMHENKYHKVKVTFDQENGGDDFDDVYIYWFNSKTFKPDYLAYEFHVNGGGLRFREAYNERYLKGIRFVDYRNYKPITDSGSIFKIDSLYLKGKLEVLSKIELKNIQVNLGNYN